MRGLPKHFNNPKDYENTIRIYPHLKEQVLEHLRAIADAGDDKAIGVVSGSEETGDLATEEIENPMPLWKQKGFVSREDLRDLIGQHGGYKEERLNASSDDGGSLNPRLL